MTSERIVHTLPRCGKDSLPWLRNPEQNTRWVNSNTVFNQPPMFLWFLKWFLRSFPMQNDLKWDDITSDITPWDHESILTVAKKHIIPVDSGHTVGRNQANQLIALVYPIIYVLLFHPMSYSCRFLGLVKQPKIRMNLNSHHHMSRIPPESWLAYC